MESKWIETAKKFRELCEAHDITYDFSDDSTVYRRGDDQYKQIVEVSKQIPRNLAVQIWNETVEKKLLPNAWDDYKWK